MNLKAKKHLGQNFLTNKEIVKKIIKAANLRPDDFVLEIGPGKGVLTEELAGKAGKVLAIEIDKVLSSLLLNKFSNRKNVEIIEGDELKIKMQKSKCKMTNQNLKIEKIHNTLYIILDTNYKIVANLPYYITSPIIKLFLESDYPPSEMILMVQKEVAERICASPREIPAESRSAKRISRGKPGNMSILSVAVQYYAQPEILFYVGKENFDPMPEVDSAIIRITSIKAKSSKLEAKNLFRVVRAGFCAKRKTLANNLANSFHLDKKEVEEKIISAGLSKNIRAQELSVKDWKKLMELF